MQESWAKVVYKEGNTDNIQVRQGFLSKEGDFYKVVGDFKTTLINANSVIAIEFKTKEDLK